MELDDNNQISKNNRKKLSKIFSKIKKSNNKRIKIKKNEDNKSDDKKVVNSSFIKRGSVDKESPILIIDNISKKFGDIQALDKVNFKLKRGERIGIIGANGAGKTTISEIIAGLLKPTSGTLSYGFKFNEVPQEKIGMQFQQSEYPTSLTVKDTISFITELRKIKVSKSEIDNLLKVFQIKDLYNRKIKSLSGGQKQKLNILMSVMHKPEIVIFDELTTGLDIAAKEEVIEFTNDLLTRQKASSILISHHMQEIEALCEKVIVLDCGKVKEIAMINDIKVKHGSLYAYAKTLIHKVNENTHDIKSVSKDIRKTKEWSFVKVLKFKFNKIKKNKNKKKEK